MYLQYQSVFFVLKVAFDPYVRIRVHNFILILTNFQHLTTH